MEQKTSKLNESILSIRKRYDTPYMVTKKALIAAGGDVDIAVELLREKYFVMGDHPKPKRTWWEEEYDAR